jgi:hypothetical protein
MKNTRYAEVAAKIARLEACKRERTVLLNRLDYIREHAKLPASDMTKTGLAAMRRKTEKELSQLRTEMAKLRVDLADAGIVDVG